MDALTTFSHCALAIFIFILCYSASKKAEKCYFYSVCSI